MLSRLLAFEIKYHIKSLLFLVGAVAFVFFGFMLTAFGIKIPQVNINSPYLIGYGIALTSIGAIFVVSLLGANAILRASESKMEALINTSQVNKFQYLGSKFIGLFSAAFITCSFIVLGMMLAPLSPSVAAERLGDFPVWHYGWNLLVIMLPNVLLFSAFTLAVSSLTKNRIGVYVSGILLYVLYMAGSIFAGAPWMAGVSPASAEAVKIAALLDPLGMSAFFEQTKDWSIIEMNTQSIALKGHFLINRIIWLSVALISLYFTYSNFSFRTLNDRKEKKSEAQDTRDVPSAAYHPVEVDPNNRNTRRLMWWSLFRIQLNAIVKSIPFLIILLLWIFIFGMELFGMLSGGSRMEGPYPITANMISLIMDMIPVFGLFIIIFYSNEQIWRNRLLKIHSINDASPVSNFILYSSNLVALTSIPFIFIMVNILMTIGTQLSMGYTELELLVYLKVFYYAGLPLVLVSVLSLLIQSVVTNRYLGMLLTAAVVLLFTSPLSTIIGIEHPLLRYAAPLFTLSPVDYTDFNGFGAYAEAFHWRMLYSVGLAMIFGLLTYGFWRRGEAYSFKERIFNFFRQLTLRNSLFMAFGILVPLGSAGFIFYKTNIAHEYVTNEQVRDWAQQYEEKYKAYEEMPQPVITSVNSKVDLYPDQQKYKVEVSYQIRNKTKKPMRKALLYLHKASRLDSIFIEKGELVNPDGRFGQFWIDFDEVLKPDEACSVFVRFESGWSGFAQHDIKNAIIGNGSFMRISEFFPQFGYNPEMEITSVDARKERGMPERIERINTFEDFEKEKAVGKDMYDYISYETIVSTKAPQTAIGQGKLIKQWTEGNRNYFHYKMDRKIPFRFAFSSAVYAKKTVAYKGVDIEVYAHPKHQYNVDRIIELSKQTLDYCTKHFGAYQYDHFRYAEVASFTGGFGATSYPNTIYHNEKMGFITQIKDSSDIDVIAQFVGHELGHQWWGGQLDAPVMEGAIVLSETLAQYTELMIYEHAYKNHRLITDALDIEQGIYFGNRGFKEEVPLYKAGYDHQHIPYSKGIKVMYAVKELIGEAALNKALKNLIDKYAYPQEPATVNELLTELYAVTPPTQHELLNDWFKKIVTYDVSVEQADYKELDNGTYEVTITLKAEKWEEDGFGSKEKAEFSLPVKIGIFNGDRFKEQHILYLKDQFIDAEITELSFIVEDKPTLVGIDPHHVLLDKNVSNNLKAL